MDPDRQEAELDKLKWARPIVTNPTNEYVHEPHAMAELVDLLVAGLKTR